MRLHLIALVLLVIAGTAAGFVLISPLAVALSVAAGAEVGGIVGALLGIPIAGALKVVSQEILASHKGEDSAKKPSKGQPHVRNRSSKQAA